MWRFCREWILPFLFGVFLAFFIPFCALVYVMYPRPTFSEGVSPDDKWGFELKSVDGAIVLYIKGCEGQIVDSEVLAKYYDAQEDVGFDCTRVQISNDEIYVVDDGETLVLVSREDYEDSLCPE
ncbi:MAG: hypothetical protein R3C18_18020 [Planctomycetaceae bacterium]